MQAQHVKVGALAGLAQAQAQHERVRRLLERSAATPQEMEQAEAAFRQAEAAVAAADEAINAAVAAVQRAAEMVREMEVAAGYSRVVAPFAGVVVKRFVDPGDLAWPGRPLFRLMAPEDMQLEAHVREGLAGRAQVGQQVRVTIDALDKTFTGTVREVVPSADPASRTFAVKVALPADPRLLPGMFGRLDIPVATRRAVVVPTAAVRTLGQLTLVRVKDDGGWQLRAVRLGEPAGADAVEVLAGLRPGETIEVPSEDSTR